MHTWSQNAIDRKDLGLGCSLMEQIGYNPYPDLLTSNYVLQPTSTISY